MSIRKFLLVNLLATILIITALTVIGNYYLSLKDIQNSIDESLADAALSFQVVVNASGNEHTLKQLQQAIDQMSSQTTSTMSNNKKLIPTKHFYYKDQFELQIWTKNNVLLAHSAHAPLTPLSFEKTTGFSDQELDNKSWRVFTLIDSKTGIRVILAVHSQMRYQLALKIALYYCYILFIMLPLAGIVIWLTINRTLAGFNELAKELAKRHPHFPTQTYISNIPMELIPIVDKINQLFEHLEQGLEREQRFAADAAHELRTPLAALKTQAQVALQASETLEKENALRNVIASVDRSSHVVQQLLTLSRLTSDISYTQAFTQVNLGKLTAEVMAELAPLAISKNLDFDLTPDPLLQKTTITGNIIALNILIRNLIDNAIRYTPEGGYVHVSTEETTQNVILHVIDNGPGIPYELHARVFERFFRTLGNKSPGSGLGLAIVQQIAILHHAEVKLCTPRNNQGLEIQVIFDKSNG